MAHPFHPIIYVRGYAIKDKEIDETTADPFCGFNLGSTVYRPPTEKGRPTRKFVFQSPVVRLASDFGYRDVFENGLDIVDTAWHRPIPPKSIIVYRYYEEDSRLLGAGRRREIEKYVEGLSKLIEKVREYVIGYTGPGCYEKVEDFHCYLVAHSMGGLVCRAFLQNPDLKFTTVKRYVDKVFTYATPHNGIELGRFEAAEWISYNDSYLFNPKRMSRYLNIKNLYENNTERPNRADWLPEKAFHSRKFFCMIGTNRADYDVGSWLLRVRTLAGKGSDGLVKIENASVRGIDDNERESSPPCPTAYAYRSHSGYFGIVNSEESYQNLTRFLFGDIRVDIWVDIQGFNAPPGIAPEKVKAMYQIEVSASPRGSRRYLTRRRAEDDSAERCSSEDLIDFERVTDNWRQKNLHARLNRPFEPAKIFKSKEIYLSSIFLFSDKDAKDDQEANKSLAFITNLGIPNPDYEIVEVERRTGDEMTKNHFEGVYLFQDSVIVDITPPTRNQETWQVRYGWQSQEKLTATTSPLRGEERVGGDAMTGRVKGIDDNMNMELQIPFGSVTTPGIRGDLRFVVSKWNTQ